jgi:hypothetical protein
LGGASDTGGAAELCPLALFCAEMPIKMRLRASSVARRIGVLQMVWFKIDRMAFPANAEEYQDRHDRPSAHDPLCCPTGKTRQCLVNRRASKYSYLQKFCFGVKAETSRPPQGRFAIVTRRGRDAVAATASAREVGCRAVIP